MSFQELRELFIAHDNNVINDVEFLVLFKNYASKKKIRSFLPIITHGLDLKHARRLVLGRVSS